MDWEDVMRKDLNITEILKQNLHRKMSVVEVRQSIQKNVYKRQ